MSVTTFFCNEALWQALRARIKGSRRVDAAIAYFGQGGARLLPLRRGDRLIVDMSPATVRAGGTDPREIEALIRRGVQVFTRRNLHAKIVVADASVLSGSANVSKRSQQVLDEAALLTNDSSAVRRAREFIDRLCSEPVRPEYLEECKRIYRPPRLNGQRAGQKHRKQRVKHAKLWFVALRDYWIPQSEIERYQQGEERARKLIRDHGRSTMESFHWPHKPRMATELQFGDWLIEVVTHKDRSTTVNAPGQFLLMHHYIRHGRSGKQRWVFHLEIPKRGEAMTWRRFLRAARPVLGANGFKSPRTKPIRDIETADGILRLWTPGGRISRG